MRLPDEWAVFPLYPIVSDERSPLRKNKRLCGCLDPTCGNAGKHPMYKWGELTAGEKAPIPENCGIGLACGVRSGVVVIDLDIKPDKGVNGLEALAMLGEIPDTLTVVTPSGGLHLYFQWPGWAVVTNSSVVAPGVDVRGDRNGYVVLPDSPHDNGGRYTFLNWGTPVAPLPDWLAGRLARSPGADNAPFLYPFLPTPEV